MPGLKDESYRYIEFLTSSDDDQAAQDGTLWPHQWESFLRLVYAHEILGKTESEIVKKMLPSLSNDPHFRIGRPKRPLTCAVADFDPTVTHVRESGCASVRPANRAREARRLCPMPGERRAAAAACGRSRRD